MKSIASKDIPSKDIVGWLLKGMVIGVANIIPGVSGGTMALVLGIYDRLLRALGRFRAASLGQVLAVVRSRDRRAALRDFASHHDLAFLSSIGLGAALALVLLSRVLEYLLGNHPVPTYGFFFGLVAASIVVPLSLLRRRSWIEVTTAVVAIAVTVGASEPSRRSEWSTERERVVREAAGDASPSPIVERSGGGGTPGLPRVFAAGAVAISAMILPGISGSFVLLLLGLYQDMLRAINEWNVLVLVTFLLGCLTGVILFVKFLNFLLARFYSPTMAFMTGLMVGSLWILWPVKERGYVGRVQHHILPNRWPASIDAPELGALIAALVGALLVVAFFLYNRKVARSGG